MRLVELPTEVARPRALVFLIHTPSLAVKSVARSMPALLFSDTHSTVLGPKTYFWKFVLPAPSLTMRSMSVSTRLPWR